MEESRRIKISKYISKHLRHQPDRLGLVLEEGGWISVDRFLDAAKAGNFPISRSELEFVVQNCDKQRFALDASGDRIRANQGHTIEVDLQLQPQVPPEILYHGTNKEAVAGIESSGLLKMARHHVHLSTNLETARRVGSRRGQVVIYGVRALALQQTGIDFFQADNGVWLVDHVPPEYLTQLDEMGSDASHSD
jgi:putative RNA 2'-phosphotransferase